MFELDMQALRESAGVQLPDVNAPCWLMAIPANPANSGGALANPEPKLATVAELAVSHGVTRESADLLAARLIAAAMRACAFHADGLAARAQMRAEVLATPEHLRADLLAHFQKVYPEGRRPEEGSGV